MSNKLTNLNDYTLIDKNATVIDIYFYPAHSITKTKVNKLEKELCIRFLIERREDGLCDMHCSLITNLNKEIYNSYNILSKEIETNKFAFVREIDDSGDAEVLPKGVIDFNLLDYDYFLSILKDSEDLKKLVPYLAEHLRNNIKTIQEVQERVEHLNVMGPSSYYQNMIAYFVDQIEEISNDPEEKQFHDKILENIKKNFDIVFVKDQLQIDLSYINLIAIIIKNIKSNFIKPISYLESKELRCDLLKNHITTEELDSIIKNIQEDYKEDDHKEISSVNERIKFHLKTKPYIKEFKNYLKIIIADDHFLNEDNSGLVDEEKLKDTIIECLTNFTYRSLERNLVLLYNINEDKCDFICIASIDFIFSLLQTYRLNSQVENQCYISDYKALLNLYRKNDQLSNDEKLRIYILIILMLNIYYYKNLGSLVLFNKGEYILKLDFKKGEYDIQAINRETEETIGHLIKISPKTKEDIKASLAKNEKTFNELINSILLENIEENISLGTVKTDINSLKHKDIVIYLTKNRKKDIFDLTLTLDELLILLTEFKPVSDVKKQPKKTPKKQETEEIVVIENDKDKDKAFVLRKADTIYNIMEINEIDSDEYKTIASLYKNYLKEDDKDKKNKIYKELSKIILK